MGTINNIIKKQPFWIKKLYYDTVPFAFRYGTEFLRTYNRILSNLEKEESVLRDLQFKQLRDLLIHSYKNVPYYKNIFLEYSFDPYRMQSPEDIKILPYLTKDIINQNFDDLIAVNYNKGNLHRLKTSGSTGKKLLFMADDSVYKREAAFVLRSYITHGATMYDKPSIWLRRYVPTEDNNKLFYYDHELRRLYMSAYHLNEKTIDLYLEEINKNDYHTLVGYPSSIYSFACLLEETSKKLEIKSIHTASEMMLPQWRDKINNIFNLRVKSHYGQMEKVSMFIQDNNDENYYDCLDYSYNEFIEEDKDKVIVGTGFINYAMPFIRYRTNDTVSLLSREECKNSTGFPKYIQQINGRSDDILLSTNGTRIPGVNFYTMMYKIDGIKMFQIVQKSRDLIEFRIVPNETYSINTLNLIKKGLTERIGDVKINFIFLPAIERSKETGKIRCIYNEIQ